MERNAVKFLWIVALLIIVIVFINAIYDGRARKAARLANTITAQEADFLTHELKRRCAGDCELIRTWYGFRCIEMESGRVFKIYM